MTPNEAEYFRSIGRLEAQVASLTSAIGELKLKVDSVDARMDTIDRMANRWKGGFTVILGIGALLGYIVDHAIRWFSAK